MGGLLKSTFQYRRLQLIGEGNFGKVHYIRDIQLKGNFAAKEILLTDFDNDDVDTLFAEAEAMNAARCPHVVPINSAGRNDKHVVLVMPYYKNGSLADAIAHHPLQLSRAIKVQQDILMGLAAIHRAKIIHFDIKPSNVLFDANGNALVADFGQARRIRRGGHANAPGLYQWSKPPETIDSFTGSYAADIFHAGATFYRALNGDGWYYEQRNRFPARTIPEIEALDKAIRKGQFPDSKRFMPHVPKSLRRIVRAAMNIDPVKRYQTAKEFGDALGSVVPDHDWSVQTDPDRTTWTSVRPGYSTTQVEMTVTSYGFRTDVYKVSDDGKRRRQTDMCGHKFPSRAEAYSHLEENVFSSLS